ncbi:MAG: heavy metal translocating P-type ATPase [Chloroflexota bacterium]
MFFLSSVIVGVTAYTGIIQYNRHTRQQAIPFGGDGKDINSRLVNLLAGTQSDNLFLLVLREQFQQPINIVRKWKQKFFLEEERSQHIQEMSSNISSSEISEAEKQINLNFTLALISLGLTTAGTFLSSPLIWAGIPLLAYTSVEMVQNGFKSIFKERRLGMSVVDMLALPGMVVTGHLLIASIAYSFYYFGRRLSNSVKRQSQQKLITMFGSQPQFVWVQQGDVEVEVPFDTLKQGDVIVVNAGSMIPADGVVIFGNALVDQHVLTGESQPIEKSNDDQTFASTMVLSGKLHIKVEKAGAETISAQISTMLAQTAEHKTYLQLRGEKIADASALPILLMAGFTWPLLGIESAFAVLQAGFGYTMRVIAPISTLNFLNIASQKGILIKEGYVLETLHSIDTVIFDKTGTLTLDQPQVANIYTFQNHTKNELLTYAATAEARQSHPIARAIQQAATERQLQVFDVENASYEIGYGIKVQLEDSVIQVGSSRFMELEGIALTKEAHQLQEDILKTGNSLIYIAIDEHLAGAIELQPLLRLNAKKVVQHLQKRGISVMIISGDHEKPTCRLAEELGVDDYFANTLPEDKATHIQSLQNEGKRVCFIGDGINDAIALKQADVSISLRGASTLATDTAQIILMNQNLPQIIQLLELTDQFENNMKKNFLATVIPGVICIGGVLFLNFGIVAACILFDLGLFAGLTNAMLPLRQQSTQ